MVSTWNTVRIAAGNVSKLVVGVSSSKLNLKKRDDELWIIFLGWASRVLMSQLCSNFKVLLFFSFFSFCLLTKTVLICSNNNVSLHLHIKAEQNPFLCISGTNNKNTINMLSYFANLLHVHSQGLCRSLITAECKEMIETREETLPMRESPYQGLVLF